MKSFLVPKLLLGNALAPKLCFEFVLKGNLTLTHNPLPIVLEENTTNRPSLWPSWSLASSVFPSRSLGTRDINFIWLKCYLISNLF